MVKPTTEQALAMLLQIKNRNIPGSVKYYAMGFLRIALRNNLIKVDDLVLEFPELDRPVQSDFDDLIRGMERKDTLPKEKRD